MHRLTSTIAVAMAICHIGILFTMWRVSRLVCAPVDLNRNRNMVAAGHCWAMGCLHFYLYHYYYRIDNSNCMRARGKSMEWKWINSFKYDFDRLYYSYMLQHCMAQTHSTYRWHLTFRLNPKNE